MLTEMLTPDQLVHVGEALALVMFAVLCGVLLMGYHVAFTLAGVGLLFALLGAWLGVLDLKHLGLIPSRYFGIMNNDLLVAVPLFVFMGVVLERSRIAEELLTTMGQLFGNLRGGLALSVIFIGALLAASTGIVGATVVTMGILSLPAMMRAGYCPKLATGTICASGTLGQIIPPSIVLVLLGDILQGPYSRVRQEQIEAERQQLMNEGRFADIDWSASPEPISVVDFFAAAVIPGLMLVGMYSAWVLFVAFRQPDRAPAIPIPEDERAALKMKALKVLVPPLLLMLIVLGSIFAGIATPTEAAAVGAFGAMTLAALLRRHERCIACTDAMMAMIRGRTLTPDGVSPEMIRAGRLRLGFWALLLAAIALFITLFGIGKMQSDLAAEASRAGEAGLGTGDYILAFVVNIIAFPVVLLAAGFITRSRALRSEMHDICKSAMNITTMVFLILFGATIFSLVFSEMGGEELVTDALSALPGGQWGAIFAVMLIMFILGFFLDFIEITFVVVPIVSPVLFKLGVDPIWLGIMIAINLQTSFLTPPFGFALFYLRGVADKAISTLDIYRGILPFVVIQLIALALLALFPGLATWLPRVLLN
ncbi:MAG: hypothetical protein Alpg2KO_02140 [Alphaproteobacteria bacterium]